jgi:DNA invertase Pin-like site-specific DNA recombinase
MKRPRRVLGYARVSSELQGQGSSLRDQQAAIAAYGAAQRIPEPTFYVEAESGIREREERREQMRALMADVREGDLVICDKIDRWSRDPEFTYRSIRQILERGASFYAVGDQCDPSTPEGDTMLNFRVLFAREEHKRIKQRMVGTRKLLRDQGYYVEGLSPFGYRRAHPKGYKGAEKNILIVEPKEAETVRRIFALCIAGHSITEVAAKLNVNRDRVADALNNRVYLGEIDDSRGRWIKAKHAPLIDADTFARARAALEGRRHGPRPGEGATATSTWILRDVARCALCGARMSAAYNGKGPKRRYYYRCYKKCTSRYVPVLAVEAEAEPLIVARLAELREELGREPTRAPVAPAADVAGRRAKIQKKRERYLEAFADDLMSRDELRAAMAKLDAATLKLDAEEQAARKPSVLTDTSVRRSVLREVRNIARAWKLAPAEDRRKIVEHLAHAARLAAGMGCVFEWRAAEEMAEAIQ